MSRTKLNALLKEFEEDEAELAGDLFNLRQSPGPALQRRVQAIPNQEAKWWRLFKISRLAWAASAVLVLGLLFGSPTARARLGEVTRLIGQIPLVIREGMPNSPTKTVVVEKKTVSLAEAKAAVPFKISLPTYLPADLAPAEKEVLVLNLDTPEVKVEWRDAGGGVVQLTIRPDPPERSSIETLVGPNSAEPVLVNGRQAVVVRGGWDHSTGVWGHEEEIMTLIWKAGGMQYRLLAAQTTLSLEEVIVMAESIR